MVRVNIFGPNENEWLVVGEEGYRLSLREKVAQLTMNESHWVLGNNSIYPANDSQVQSPFGEYLARAGVVFHSPLLPISKDSLPVIEAATCLLGERDISVGMAPRHFLDRHLGLATEETLQKLNSALLGLRQPLFKVAPTGEIIDHPDTEAPAAMIQCRLKAGKTIGIYYFSNSDYWAVDGESNFCLDVTPAWTMSILSQFAWDNSGG